MKYTAIFILCSFLKLTLYPQELLPNGNFEVNTGIPTSWGQSYLLKYWNQVSNGKWSPLTYFYDFENKGYIPTWREGGRQLPYSGYGFAGLGIAFKDVEKIGSQYLETELLYPLEKDTLYIISAFVSLIDRAQYALDYIPVALSETHLLRANGKPIYTSNLVRLQADVPYLENKIEWTKVSVKYRAKGGERFFIIGGIEGNRKLGTAFKIKRMPFEFSFQYLLLNKLTYYFIDNISIHKLYPSVVVPKDAIISDLNTVRSRKDKIILSDITFEVNSFVFKDTVNEQLDNLVFDFLNCSNCSLKIIGYTDNTGLSNANLKLSMSRAKSVYEYLNNKGIPYEKMDYVGLGENNPIADNNMVEGRSKNRRVEIQIIDNNL